MMRASSRHGRSQPSKNGHKNRTARSIADDLREIADCALKGEGFKVPKGHEGTSIFRASLEVSFQLEGDLPAGRQRGSGKQSAKVDYIQPITDIAHAHLHAGRALALLPYHCSYRQIQTEAGANAPTIEVDALKNGLRNDLLLVLAGIIIRQFHRQSAAVVRLASDPDSRMRLPSHLCRGGVALVLSDGKHQSRLAQIRSISAFD